MTKYHTNFNTNNKEKLRILILKIGKKITVIRILILKIWKKITAISTMVYQNSNQQVYINTNPKPHNNNINIAANIKSLKTSYSLHPQNGYGNGN